MGSKELHAKGYDCYVILRWLHETLETQPSPDPCQKVRALIFCADSFTSCLSTGDMFLSAEEATHAKVMGETFLKLYISLIHDHPTVWHLRPKVHMLWHLSCDAWLRKSRRCPLLDSCWQDEDWLKHVARLLRRCHARTAQLTLLQRYLLLLQSKLG